ncbi:MAG: GNAT family N-acetyltransferase [Prevotella salivae]|nr:GNAT family N-acetyltransferase [Segatella salivae]
MFEIKPYSPEMKSEWDAFVDASKNGLFLFFRDYMDYHHDRFEDHSIVVYRQNKLYALLPANISHDVLYTHQGLTFGGLIVNEHFTAAESITVFKLINAYFRNKGIRKVVYKAIPWLYHQQPAEEDLYAIYRTTNAKLVARDISTAIRLDMPLAYNEMRNRGIKKALHHGIMVEESNRWTDFWKVLTTNLQTKYHVSPVHSLSEIRMLKARFPHNIRLFTAQQNSKVLGGTVVYEYGNVAHTQYISASLEGKKLHALDLLLDKLIHEVYQDKTWFDFGKSTEQQGTILNEGLIFQKESFGGRAVCYDWYEWDL